VTSRVSYPFCLRVACSPCLVSYFWEGVVAGVKLGMLKVLIIQIDLDGLRVVVVERGEGFAWTCSVSVAGVEGLPPTRSTEGGGAWGVCM